MTLVFSGRWDNLNHPISAPVISDSPNGLPKLSGTSAFGSAGMQGGIAHDLRLTGDFRMRGGEITGTLTGISVSWLGYSTYSISGFEVDAAGYIAAARSATFLGEEIWEFFGSEGAFGSGAPGETVRGTPLADTLAGSYGDDIMVGRAGGDSLDGSLGDDTIRGQGGADTLTGGVGRDTLRGGAGADEIHGGGGADRIFGDAGGDLVDAGEGDDRVEGGRGADQVHAGFGDDVVLGGGGRDHAEGGEGDDRLLGGGGSDRLAGDAGDDVLVGGGGGDALEGGLGRDVLRGGAGGDTLDGGNDGDRIDGGAGDDLLTGGTGEDLFVFRRARAPEADTIADFDIVQDRIALRGGPADYAIETGEGGAALLVHGARSILFEGVDAGSLTASLAAYDPLG